ncbi:hypothetical protein J1N35_036696 [Gossypium stocksii]|uniref:RNase H type-1 domain-containing protein n=1 Tax=Gossypium stocksii TaxID=47602 RepID=A0A9D3UIF9_9ROSI|nr:hypothetical protein J1N35_036696 [Gossypium stocksii]
MFGNWLVGYDPQEGVASVLEAELWARGFRSPSERGSQKDFVECDSPLVVQLLNDGVADLSSLALVQNIAELCCPEWGVSVPHISRGANQVADYMAKQGLAMRLLNNLLV